MTETTYRTYDLDNCVICKRALPESMRDWAHRRFEEMTCSPECSAEKTRRHFGCCDKAKFLDRYCVCMYAFNCEVHGETHIGTHD